MERNETLRETPPPRSLTADPDELSEDALDSVAGGLERAWIGDGIPIVPAAAVPAA